jgi:hypothetical protein
LCTVQQTTNFPYIYSKSTEAFKFLGQAIFSLLEKKDPPDLQWVRVFFHYYTLWVYSRNLYKTKTWYHDAQFFLRIERNFKSVPYKIIYAPVCYYSHLIPLFFSEFEHVIRLINYSF